MENSVFELRKSRRPYCAFKTYNKYLTYLQVRKDDDQGWWKFPWETCRYGDESRIASPMRKRLSKVSDVHNLIAKLFSETVALI